MHHWLLDMKNANATAKLSFPTLVPDLIGDPGNLYGNPVSFSSLTVGKTKDAGSPIGSGMTGEEVGMVNVQQHSMRAIYVTR